MIASGEQEQTHHYRGRFFGFGPIADSENLVLAVFEQTKRDGERLSLASFDRKQLVKVNQSIARQQFTRQSVFQAKVVDRGEATKGKFIGVAMISAEKLRSIYCDQFPGAKPKKTFGFGALDKVESGDFDSHGAFGFLEEAVVPRPREVAALRELLILDLASRFSTIFPIGDIVWGSRFSFVVGRAKAFCRACRQTGMAIET